MEKKATTTKVKRTTGKKQSQKKLPTAMPTLLQAIERVVELSKDSQLSDDFMQQASPEIGLISDSYGISDVQAVLFCVCMERGPRRVDYDDLASHLDLSKIRILRYASDIDALVHRRLLRYRDAKEESTSCRSARASTALSSLSCSEGGLTISTAAPSLLATCGTKFMPCSRITSRSALRD